MAFFTKQEIIERMQALRARDAAPRADVNLALIILGSSLFEKKQKSGEDYGIHPLHVGMTNTRDTVKKIIGILHDVVEDSDWTVDDLRAVGFSGRIVAGVDAMTHRENEKYFDSIERCSLNTDACDRKVEDLSHNLDVSRLEKFVSDKDVERINKYILARAYLMAVKKQDIKPGSSIIDFALSRVDFMMQGTTPDLLKKYSSHVHVRMHAPKGAKKAFRAKG